MLGNNQTERQQPGGEEKDALEFDPARISDVFHTINSPPSKMGCRADWFKYFFLIAPSPVEGIDISLIDISSGLAVALEVGFARFFDRGVAGIGSLFWVSALFSCRGEKAQKTCYSAKRTGLD